MAVTLSEKNVEIMWTHTMKFLYFSHEIEVEISFQNLM